jgi:collagenase-like PrtC family protease
VAELYGQLDDDPVGGGRARYLQAHASLRQAATHIQRARDRGVGFSYLLNAPCLDNREYRAAFRGALGERLRWALGAGITGVTVSVPLLAELVKGSFPQLRVKVSTIAHVGSVRRLRMWEDIGVDEVTVDFERNRDLALLAALAGAARCELSLLVNDLCLLDCAFRHYHYNVAGHASQAGHDGALIDYCFLRCHRLKVQQPVELLRSPWIRPEDLARYEALGIARFKLAGRTSPTARIAAIARAYGSRRSPENLLDVLAGTGRDTGGIAHAALRTAAHQAPGLLGRGLAVLGRLPPGSLDQGNFAALMAALPPQAREELLPAFAALMRLSETVRIDGRALEGFLDGFAGRRCGVECETCRHCETWVARAVRVDPAGARAIVEALERAIDGVVGGRALPG